ncbi:hemagglutinin/hemolysin-related protein [Apostichopus japonicus]|uniref:Hemagglutinin/hemolysin-related protein n=1 Tax=Stichopus japonicus TaxID=307972 RepID=A0A2G8KT78_STIJA|nr:hemagglutinin/hemolysin-related protein [Apostichopus japonicus]
MAFHGTLNLPYHDHTEESDISLTPVSPDYHGGGGGGRGCWPGVLCIWRSLQVPALSLKGPRMEQESGYIQFVFAIPSAICASPTVQLFIGSSSAVTNATGRIFFPLDDTIPDIPFELGYNEGHFFHFSLNAVLHEDDLNSKVYTAAAIEADVPIHAYGHHHCTPSTHRSDAFRLLPIEQLGVDYWVLTFQNAGVSQVAITAIDNDTVVKITLDSLMVSTMLNQFETYYLGGMYDPSGMHVQANKPVCVLAGNSLDKSDDVVTNSGDSFYECLIPVSKWSNSYSIVRYPSLEGLSVLRIITPFTDAVINYPDVGVNIISTTGGGVLTDLELNHVTNTSMYFTSAKPFLLAHFTTPRPLLSSGGILSMLYVFSAKQATSSKFTFPIFSLPVDILTAYIHVWIPQGFSFSDLFVNSAITYDWEMIATDIEGFQIAQLSNLNNESYYVIDSNGAFNFSGVIYVSAYKQYYAFPL